MDTNKLNGQPNSAISFPPSVGGGIAGVNTLWLIFYSYLQVLINSAPAPMRLDELEAEIKDAHARCQASPMAGLLYARNAGELLLEAQAKLSLDVWEIWLKANCNISARTAETYMQMAKGWPSLQNDKRRDVARKSIEEEESVLTPEVVEILEVVAASEEHDVTAVEVENLEIVDVSNLR